MLGETPKKCEPSCWSQCQVGEWILQEDCLSLAGLCVCTREEWAVWKAALQDTLWSIKYNSWRNTGPQWFFWITKFSDLLLQSAASYKEFHQLILKVVMLLFCAHSHYCHDIPGPPMMSRNLAICILRYFQLIGYSLFLHSRGNSFQHKSPASICRQKSHPCLAVALVAQQAKVVSLLRLAVPFLEPPTEDITFGPRWQLFVSSREVCWSHWYCLVLFYHMCI